MLFANMNTCLFVIPDIFGHVQKNIICILQFSG